MALTLNSLQGRIEEIADKLVGEELLTKAALLVLPASQKRTRVLTGNLRRSETYQVERDIAYVGTTVEYAQYQPEPFLELGLEDAQPDIQRMLVDYGNAVLARVGR